jgi:hypothetical protein
MATINYVAAATAIDPTAAFSSLVSVFDYDSLVWVSTPIPEATLEARWLAIEKQKQIAKLIVAGQTEVASGFLSDALVSGVMRKYNSDLQSQLSILGAVDLLSPANPVAPATIRLRSTDVSTGLQSYADYTLTQAYKLLTHFGQFAAAIAAKGETKGAQIMSVNSGDVHADLDVVYAITW